MQIPFFPIASLLILRWLQIILLIFFLRSSIVAILLLLNTSPFIITWHYWKHLFYCVTLPEKHYSNYVIQNTLSKIHYYLEHLKNHSEFLKYIIYLYNSTYFKFYLFTKNINQIFELFMVNFNLLFIFLFLCRLWI